MTRPSGAGYRGGGGVSAWVRSSRKCANLDLSGLLSPPSSSRSRLRPAGSPTIALRVVHCRCVSQIIQVLLIFMLPGLLLPVVLLVVLVMTRSAVGVVVVHVAIIVVLLGMIALLGMMR
jgi:hypothetical protein